jgi:hypothetical protein
VGGEKGEQRVFVPRLGDSENKSELQVRKSKVNIDRFTMFSSIPLQFQTLSQKAEHQADVQRTTS